MTSTAEPVVLDACVLAESAISDLLLRLSESSGLLSPRWSSEIWAEVRRTYIEKLGWHEALADSRIRAATEFFPHAMVSGFEQIAAKCTNHPNDRHVLAAAIHSKSKIVVTFNVKDFTQESLEPWGISASRPADFLKALFDRDASTVTCALEAMSHAANRTTADMLARLSWYARPFSEHVAEALSINVPTIAPKDWRRSPPT